MLDYDLIVRGAHPLPAIGIVDGQFAAFADGSAHATIDATGLLVLPGVIDAHVHFNEPGRTDWEGWATGSRAAVAGGVTTVCDMPLNSHPPVVTAEAFEAKHRAAAAQAVCDFALWGGLVPGHVGDLDALASCGVIGFKAFMADSGIEDFPKVDVATLRDGMRRAAALRLPVAVHAEIDGHARSRIGRGSAVRDSGIAGAASAAGAMRASDARASNRSPHSPHSPHSLHSPHSPYPPDPSHPAHPLHPSHAGAIADYLASRPVESECEAIRIALDLAGETGCALHIVHVSSGRGVSLIAEARARGVDVTAETCPHYLVFTSGDLARLGAVAKCAPPLRDAAERDGLLAHLRAGRIDTLGSDHSPAPWAMKAHDDFFKVWGGIAGVQHLLPLVLDTGLDAGFDADLVARLTAEQVARRFRLAKKGRLAAGVDADLTLVDMDRSAASAESGAFEITADTLLYRHRISPYVGRRLRARVRHTILRGRIVLRDGQVVADSGGTGGRLIAPTPSS